jgi:hypothetical protein
MLIWIKSALSPQEIRDRIMDRSSDFQQRMVQYIEAVYKGEFFDGNMANISQRVKEAQHNDSEYVDPTKTMPEPPPERCQEKNCESCEKCTELNNWWTIFRQTVDDLFFFFFKSKIYNAELEHRPRQTIQMKYYLQVYKGACLEGDCHPDVALSSGWD